MWMGPGVTLVVSAGEESAFELKQGTESGEVSGRRTCRGVTQSFMSVTR